MCWKQGSYERPRRAEGGERLRNGSTLRFFLVAVAVRVEVVDSLTESVPSRTALRSEGLFVGEA